MTDDPAPIEERHELLPPVPPDRIVVSRRRVVGALITASATAVAGVYFADAGRRIRTISGVRDWSRDALGNLRDLLASGPEPLPRTLEAEAEYSAFLAEIPLRYIVPEEVIRPHRNVRSGVPNELPPREYWPRIEAVLKVADEIRHRLGKPLHCINSAYRSPAYNAACSGTATFSQHLENRALDLMFVGGSGAAAEVARKLREEKLFRGGIGVYDDFIHIDTRGRNADWDSRSGV